MQGEIVTPHSAPELTDGEHHPTHAEHERPEQWGWHREFRTGRQVMGWICVAVLLLMLTATHYNLAGALSIITAAVCIAAGLIWDIHNRRTQWRS
jgi:Protein of unknown function (DUF2631)